jgi:parallel beta-helix repeat protein
MKMRVTKKSFEKITMFLFLALLIFTTIYLVILGIIPFLHPKINSLSLGIYINDDSDFETYNFPGFGTPSDPYLIENYTYQKHGLHEIYISRVSKHFIIRNNVIASKGYKNGITVGGMSQNITIFNNTILGSDYIKDGCEGISIWNLENCKIVNNSIFSKRQGIRVWSCSNCTISQNKMKNGRNIGIFESSNIGIENNSLRFDEFQNAWDTHDSLYITNSENTSIIQNELFKSWIAFSDDSILTATLQDNRINGQEIGFFKNESNFLLDSSGSYGQILLISCSNGTI